MFSCYMQRDRVRLVTSNNKQSNNLNRKHVFHTFTFQILSTYSTELFACTYNDVLFSIGIATLVHFRFYL